MSLDVKWIGPDTEQRPLILEYCLSGGTFSRFLPEEYQRVQHLIDRILEADNGNVLQLTEEELEWTKTDWFKYELNRRDK